MRLPISLLLTAAMLAGSSLQATPKPVVALPFTSKWIVKYDDNSCHLMAQFGDPADGIALKMTRFQPGDKFDLTLYGKPLKAKGLFADVTLNFGLSDKPMKRSALAGKADQIPLLFLGGQRIDGVYGDDQHQPPPVTAAQEAAATALTIGYRGQEYRLETGRLDRPLAKLRECETDLVKFWGYDPMVQAQLTQPPIPSTNYTRWLRSAEFPTEAMIHGRSGRVKVRLDVSETGAVTNCAVLEQTNPPEFGKATCKFLTIRGKFKPALDKDGKPTRSYWINSVTWIS